MSAGWMETFNAAGFVTQPCARGPRPAPLPSRLQPEALLRWLLLFSPTVAALVHALIL